MLNRFVESHGLCFPKNAQRHLVQAIGLRQKTYIAHTAQSFSKIHATMAMRLKRSLGVLIEQFKSELFDL